MITPVAFENIKHHTYTIFAIINAIMVPSVYFFFPETAYRSLEEMDNIFGKVSGFKGAFDIVKVAREEPRRYGKNGELLIPIEDAEKTAATGGVHAHHGDASSSDNGTGVVGQEAK